MPDKGNGLSQTTIILRLLCGGYLIYLGVGLLFFTLRAGLRSWKQGGQEDDSDGPDDNKE